jgi:hypothetical protein
MISFVLITCLASTTTFAQTNLEMTDLPLKAGEGSAEPNLSKGPEGTIVLSWLEPKGKNSRLLYSQLNPTGWSEPHLVAESNNWFVNWADFPSVLAISDSLWAAHWLSKRPGGVYSYNVSLSLSSDGGKTWGDAITPHRDNTATEHGFVSLYPATDGVGLIWLDGRNTAASGSQHEHDEGHGSGGMTLRHARVSANGSLSEEVELDQLVCDCCQTSVAIAREGPVAVYRNRSEEEIRDIYITRFINGEWQPGQPVNNDGWKITGCPVNGPAVAAQGDIVAVVWFTMADDMPRVRFARSLDGGQAFSAAVDIDAKDMNGLEPKGRVDLAILDNGSAAISWLDEDENGSGAIRLQLVHSDDSLSKVHTVTTTELSRPAGFPQLRSDGNSLIVAWTDSSEKASRVKSVRINLPDLDSSHSNQ